MTGAPGVLETLGARSPSSPTEEYHTIGQQMHSSDRGSTNRLPSPTYPHPQASPRRCTRTSSPPSLPPLTSTGKIHSIWLKCTIYIFAAEAWEGQMGLARRSHFILYPPGVWHYSVSTSLIWTCRVRHGTARHATPALQCVTLASTTKASGSGPHSRTRWANHFLFKHVVYTFSSTAASLIIKTRRSTVANSRQAAYIHKHLNVKHGVSEWVSEQFLLNNTSTI